MLPTPTKRTTALSRSTRATATAAPRVGARARWIAPTIRRNPASGLSRNVRIAHRGGARRLLAMPGAVDDQDVCVGAGC